MSTYNGELTVTRYSAQKERLDLSGMLNNYPSLDLETIGSYWQDIMNTTKTNLKAWFALARDPNLVTDEAIVSKTETEAMNVADRKFGGSGLVKAKVEWKYLPEASY